MTLRSQIALFGSLLLLLLALTDPLAAQANLVSKIAYVSGDQAQSTFTLMLVDPDGSNAAPLVQDGQFSDPVWSPDGKQLAFAGAPVGSSLAEWNIYVIGADGANLRKISTHPSGNYPGAAAWSPDGQQVIYSAYSDGYIQFYTVNADGSNEQLFHLDPALTPSGGTLAWSPDGSQIALLGYQSSDSSNFLYLVNTDGSQPTRFAAAQDGHLTFSDLAWSPDGRQVLLNTLPITTSAPEAIAVASADGANVSTIIQPPPAFIDAAAWSPDGRQIVFIANDPTVDVEPPPALWIANADGGQSHALKVDGVQGLGVSWALIPASPPAAPVSLTSAQ
ncbi:MAG TPA: hypothetical protein VHD90_01340 [Phototrophicaceae bacterium]|nr:hypothetical protein [Phototrophicaceae bacterium]